MKTDWKILFIGNSFSDDTMEHAANILRSLGVQTMSLGNMYIGGCSIHRHVDNAANDRPWYEYRTNVGDGWSTREGVSLREALTSEPWDVVAIQNGTADGSRNTNAGSYEFLPILLAYIRALCPQRPKIVFNMTWVGEPWNGHPEIVAHEGNRQVMYEAVARNVRDLVAPQVDAVSPSGTAIQNARAMGLSPLSRDGYHLSYMFGRYLAGLTFVATATGLEIRDVSWRPEGVTAAMQDCGKRAVTAALATPFAVTCGNHLHEGFVSDTAAGSANQTTFESDGAWHTARVYYPLTTGGEYYSLLFTDTTDSTFADGTHSARDTLLGDWKLRDVRVGLCAISSMEQPTDPASWVSVAFGGENTVDMVPNAWVETDPVPLTAQAGDVLCVEYAFCGKTMPCHEELWIASFVDGAPSVNCPVPSRVAVKRDATRVAFVGDSITQGIGSTKNSGHHWVSRVAKALGDSYAVWNLGVGFARSEDAMADGAWLKKAKQNDVVVLCLGINDLLHGFTAADVSENLRRTVKILRSHGVRVFVQTMPPFEGLGDARDCANQYITQSLACDGVFDNGFMAAADGTPLYGGHPNDDGCALWADKLAAWLKERL